MKKPNFFIIGAPKCGTTSLAAWLAEHPQIYMSPTKEPHYFNTDQQRYLNSLQGYERLFEGANGRHRAVGEASVWYLFSETAVGNILDYSPQAKFIVLLRNPVDMAPSLHEEMVFNGREEVADFATAWSLQDERRSGARLPPMVWEPSYVQYGPACSLGAQMARLARRVSPEQTMVILLDELRADPHGTYSAVLEFLGVGDDGRHDFPVLNSAKHRRWPGLARLPWLATRVKRALGIERGFGLWGRVDVLNRVERPRSPINSTTLSMLQDYFRSDIRLLEEVTGRDLSAWLAR